MSSVSDDVISIMAEVSALREKVGNLSARADRSEDGHMAHEKDIGKLRDVLQGVDAVLQRVAPLIAEHDAKLEKLDAIRNWIIGAVVGSGLVGTGSGVALAKILTGGH